MPPFAMLRLLAITLPLFLLGEGVTTALANEGGHGGAPPPAEGGHGEAPAGEVKKPPKPKPKKPDKEKNCSWETDVEIELDTKHLKLSQLSLKNVMKGGETRQNGYDFYADTQKLVLKIRTPEGIWYIASMTRLGDLNEGCVFYMVSEPRQVNGEPPLY